MNTGTLLSIQVGMPEKRVLQQRLDFRHPNWTSGIFKTPVSGPVFIGKNGIAGDGQADLENHGGPDNVVLAYNAGHYPQWRNELQLPDLPFGGFGENFTMEGFSDENVCIGDRFRVGPVMLQVTQPRQPCYKLARRLERTEIVKLVKERGWGGWYLRVLQEGTVSAGMPMERLEQPHPQWTVQKAVWAMYARKTDPAPARELATLPELSARWKSELLELQ